MIYLLVLNVSYWWLSTTSILYFHSQSHGTLTDTLPTDRCSAFMIFTYAVRSWSSAATWWIAIWFVTDIILITDFPPPLPNHIKISVCPVLRFTAKYLGKWCVKCFLWMCISVLVGEAEMVELVNIACQTWASEHQHYEHVSVGK